MNLGGETARSFADVRAGMSSADEGVCTDVDLAGRLATINLGGASQVMPWAGSAPWVGDTVRVGYLGRKPICWTQNGAPMGTVVSADAGTIIATGDDGVTYEYPYRSGYSPVAAERVRLDHAGRFIPGKYTEEPAGSELILPTAPASGPGAAWFYPSDSAGYRFGTQYLGQNVDGSGTKSGAYWYGDVFRGTIPASAAITRMEVHLVEVFDQLPGAPSKLGTHADPATVHSATSPSITGVIDVTGSGAVNILSFASALQTGAAFGVGFEAGFGYRQFGSLVNSGAIYAEWH